MASAKYDFTIEQGSTFKRILTIKQADGTKLDLTGYSLRSIIKDFTGGTLILNLGTYSTISDSVNGEITIEIPSTKTATLNFDKAVYDFEIETVNGVVDRILHGIVTLSREVTV